MAKQDKATYESYASDEFDNPPAGPVGVHRGQRPLGVRVAPYLVVLIVAILAGALTWSLVTGEFTKITGLGGTTTAQTDTTKKDSASTSTDSSSSDQNSDDSTDSSNGSDSTDSSTDGKDSSDTTDSTDSSKTDSQNDSQSSDQNADQSAQVNKATSVRVVNASGINGYAGEKKSTLEASGYTAVEAANPTTNNLPSANVVWYQNETDKATAQDIASTLGITAVEQTSGLDVPIVVVLLN